MGSTEEDEMHQPRKPALPSNLAEFPSRRDLLRSLAGLGLGLGIIGRADPGAARKHKRKKRKKRKNKQKITTNYFGCVDVGGFCQNADQCCSGICTGEKNQKTCQAHNQSICQPGANVCAPPYIDCTTTDGDPGVCSTTTGNTGYCARSGDCFPCKRDVDCEPIYGKGSACAICTVCGVTGGTICLTTQLQT
jgi:hypothetical protein